MSYRIYLFIRWELYPRIMSSKWFPFLLATANKKNNFKMKIFLYRQNDTILPWGTCSLVSKVFGIIKFLQLSLQFILLPFYQPVLYVNACQTHRFHDQSRGSSFRQGRLTGKYIWYTAKGSKIVTPTENGIHKINATTDNTIYGIRCLTHTI